MKACKSWGFLLLIYITQRRILTFENIELLRSTLSSRRQSGAFDYIKILNVACYHPDLFFGLLLPNLPKLKRIKFSNVYQLALAVDKLIAIAEKLPDFLGNVQGLSIPPFITTPFWMHLDDDFQVEENLMVKYVSLCSLLRNSIIFLLITHLGQLYTSLKNNYGDNNSFTSSLPHFKNLTHLTLVNR
jgi:hypothetical protein